MTTVRIGSSGSLQPAFSVPVSVHTDRLIAKLSDLSGVLKGVSAQIAALLNEIAAHARNKPARPDTAGMSEEQKDASLRAHSQKMQAWKAVSVHLENQLTAVRLRARALQRDLQQLEGHLPAARKRDREAAEKVTETANDSRFLHAGEPIDSPRSEQAAAQIAKKRLLLIRLQKTTEAARRVLNTPDCSFEGFLESFERIWDRDSPTPRGRGTE